MYRAIWLAGRLGHRENLASLPKGVGEATLRLARYNIHEHSFSSLAGLMRQSMSLENFVRAEGFKRFEHFAFQT